MSDAKLVWHWADWTEKEVAAIWLPRLFLSPLAGKRTLYVSGDWSEWGPPHRNTVTHDLLGIIWRVAQASCAVVDTAERGDDTPSESRSYPTLDALADALGSLWGIDQNYVVRLGAFTLTEQDGDMFVIEAARDDLQGAFDAIAAHAKQVGWAFEDELADWPDDDD